MYMILHARTHAARDPPHPHPTRTHTGTTEHTQRHTKRSKANLIC